MKLSRETRLDLIRMMADKGITRTELAEQMQMTVSAIGKCLKGAIDLSEANMKKLHDLIINAPYKKVCSTCGRRKCICNKS